MLARVLIVAGSDSGGGAGVQADIKTVTALGAYASTAITALTAQDTRKVHAVVAVEPGFVGLQMRVVLEDLGADAVKTGMLHSAEVIEAVAAELARRSERIRLVVDPVLLSKGGDALLADSAVEALLRLLVPGCSLLTPNLPEAERLSQVTIDGPDGMRQAADRLLDLGAQAVLIKGGHGTGDRVEDLLAWPMGERWFRSERIQTRHTHGTGCTLASAIATFLAQGRELSEAVSLARQYLLAAIRAAPGLGQGHGPVHHGHCIPAAER
jgi:hydroxymethylpyrimidine/phosphomethylpyrimidine kinase